MKKFHINPTKIIISSKNLIRKINNDAVYFSANNFEKLDAECIANLLKNNQVKQESNSCFLICRTSDRNFSSTGLISALSTSLIHSNIFHHEKVFEGKINKYISCLSKNKIQISPVALIHEDQDCITSYLSIATKNKSNFQIQNGDLLYEFWKVEKTDELQTAYQKLNCFLISDGHHRIKAFKHIESSKLFLAFLISKKNIFSKKVYRQYLDLNIEQKFFCLNFLHQNFGLEEITNDRDIFYCKQFVVLCNEKKYFVKKSSSNIAKHKILSFFSKNIDLNAAGNLSFMHLSIDNYSKNIVTKNDFALIIPRFRVGKNLAYKKQYPIHSTWIEPKIPSGLISMILE